jgi:preprotein translocase subunit SecF
MGEEPKKEENREENSNLGTEKVEETINQESEKKEETQETVEESKEEIKAEENIEEPKEEKQVEEKEEPKEEKKEEVKEEPKPKKERKPFFVGIKDFYSNKYKKLLIIPFALLIISILLIGFQIATTGDFVKKDVSLKGGITITIPTEKDVDIDSLEDFLTSEFPEADLSVRNLKSAGKQVGVIIDGADVNVDDIIKVVEPGLGKLEKDDYSVAEMGSSLGATFFKETLKAIFVSFLLMGIVVFWYFGEGLKIKLISTFFTIISASLMFGGGASLIKDIIAYIIGAGLIVLYLKSSAPSFMVILNVFSDVVVTLAVVNIMGIKLSTAGIAAFLMIIGYSVDTNILLSTKLLKRKEGSVVDRLFNAMKTGMTMSFTTAAAIIVALIFTQSEVIKQIMVILLIGLIVDMIYTWLQNAGILRLYLDRKGHSHESQD